MEGQFFVKYVDEDNSSEIPLSSLAKSLSGLDQLIKDLLKVTDIKGDLEVKAQGFSKGSFVVDLIISNISHIPFDNPQDLIDFLRISNQALSESTQHFFSEIGHAHRTINDYFEQNPFDKDLVLIALGWLIGKAGKFKKSPNALPTEGPQKYGDRLNKIVKKNKFKDALSPIVNDNVREIAFSSSRNFEQASVINQTNFEDYLSEDSKILPDLHNGQEYDFQGRIVGLQINKGDTLSLKCFGLDEKEITLTCHLPDGEKASSYTDYFDKDVLVKAEVYRKSYYKKPKLILNSIGFSQLSLF